MILVIERACARGPGAASSIRSRATKLAWAAILLRQRHSTQLQEK